jgi:hypothetical protein
VTPLGEAVGGEGGYTVISEHSHNFSLFYLGYSVHQLLMSEAVLINAQVDFVLVWYEAQCFLVNLPLQKPAERVVAYPQLSSHLAEVSIFELPQGLSFSLPGKPGAAPYQFPAFGESALTITALPAATVELKVTSSAIAPDMEYFPELAHTMPIELTRATVRTFNSSLNLCIHYYFLLPSPDLPHFVTFKSEQDYSTIILSSGHGGKTSLPLIFCSGVFTTLNLLKEFCHTI